MDYCNRFDVVILQPHLSRPSVCALPFRGRRTFIPVSWDIGVRVSYDRHYSLEEPMHWDDRIYRMIMRHCAANIFYMPDPIPVWTRRGVPVETFFVAHNTVAITQTPYSPEGRKDFLFVGSLYAQKRVDLLIDAYHEALSSGGSPDGYPKLLIVGGGDEESNLMEKVRRDNLDGQVVFYHAVYDESALSRLFQRALLCISPHQAGLSVLKSFAYGTPFVTREDAITGGELFNIRNGENGILYKHDSDLAPILTDAASHPEKYLEMATPWFDRVLAGKGIDYARLNELLSLAFGGRPRDGKITRRTFENSPYTEYAYDGGKLIGCARAESDGVSQGLILNVAVDPEYQGLHIGMETVARLAAQMKGQNLFLNTHPGGVGFYSREGFRRNRTALLLPAHPDMPPETAAGFILPKGYRFDGETF